MLIDFPILLFSSLPQLVFNMIYDDEVGAWGLMIASPLMYLTALRAFEHHGSQVKWNRYEQSMMRALTVDGIIRRYFDTCTPMN